MLGKRKNSVLFAIIILQIPSFGAYYGRSFLGYGTFSSFLIAISASFRIFAMSSVLRIAFWTLVSGAFRRALVAADEDFSAQMFMVPIASGLFLSFRKILIEHPLKVTNKF